MAATGADGEVSGGGNGGGRWGLTVPWLWVIWLCFTVIDCGKTQKIQDNARRIAELEATVKAQQQERVAQPGNR